MKCRINLLPPWATAAIKSRKQTEILAAAQVAIFLLLAALFLFLNAQETQTRETATALRYTLAAFDPAPASLAAQLQQAQLAAQEEDFLLYMLPHAFDKNIIHPLLDATPEAAALTGITYRQSELILTATTATLPTAEAHRAALSEIFPYVWTGRITRTPDNTYTYEIHIFAGEE